MPLCLPRAALTANGQPPSPRPCLACLRSACLSGERRGNGPGQGLARLRQQRVRQPGAVGVQVRREALQEVTCLCVCVCGCTRAC